MFNSQRPDLEDLPTTRQLLRSTAIALATAAVILFTVVLPAEYAIDPTGIGRMLGLTQMGEIKQQLEQEAAAAEEPGAAAAEEAFAAALAEAEAKAAAPVGEGAAPVVEDPASGLRSDTLSLSLDPGQGAEIKVWADKGAEIAFSWSVDGGHVNYDAHGDPLGKKPKSFYHGYGKGKESQGESGVLVAAFDGRHGWFWRNRSGGPVTVTLKTEGKYSQIRRVL